MERLGVQGVQLWTAEDTVKCAQVGLDSDFIDLVDAVSEEMMKEAVRSEGGDLTLVGYGSVALPSIFLETRAARAPEYWVQIGSRLFESCGIPAPSKCTRLLQMSCASWCRTKEAKTPYLIRREPC